MLKFTQNHPYLLLIIENVVGLTVVLANTQCAKFTQLLPHLLPTVALFLSLKNDDSAAVVICFWSEDGPKQRNFSRESGIQQIIFSHSLAKDKSLFFGLIQEVEHCDEGTPSHKRVITSLVATFLLEVLLYVFEVDVGVGLETLLAETGLVK